MKSKVVEIDVVCDEYVTFVSNTTFKNHTSIYLCDIMPTFNKEHRVHNELVTRIQWMCYLLDHCAVCV